MTQRRADTTVKSIQTAAAQVRVDALRKWVFALAKDPLPCRTLNYKLPGHTKSTLEEADAMIEAGLQESGYDIERELVPVQPFQPDHSVPHGFRKPHPKEPWYDAYNLYVKKEGDSDAPGLIALIAHKDSQSWLSCGPGAYDNATGTAALVEIARVLAPVQTRHAIWMIFCNEEHWPWTSVTAAQTVKASGLEVSAVFNLDSLGGKPEAERLAGKQTNTTRFCTPEGEKLAALMSRLNRDYSFGLDQSGYRGAAPNDDDGSFVNAGIPAAVMNVGSMPYGDAEYHQLGDVPERVDFENVARATRLSLAAVLAVDRRAPG